MSRLGHAAAPLTAAPVTLGTALAGQRWPEPDAVPGPRGDEHAWPVRRPDLTRPVPVAVVEECLRAAWQAPGGGGGPRAHWIVITDPETRAAIGAAYRRASAVRPALTPPLDPGTADLAEHPGAAPVLVLACVDGDGVPSQGGLWNELLPAVCDYLLAARDRGLCTAWTALHLRHEGEMARLLGIPPGVRQGALIPTAYPLGAGPGPADRPPVLHRERW